MIRTPTNRFLTLLAVGMLGLAAGGCAELRDAFGFDTPTARLAGANLQDVGLESATLLFDVEVVNPLSVPLPLANLDYQLATAAEAFMSGKAALDGTVPANGARVVSLPAKISYADLFKAVKDLRPGGVVPYAAELGLSVDVPQAGPLRLPLKKEGKLPVPAAPEVEVRRIDWSQLTLEEAVGTVDLHVVNRNQFPVDLSKFAYALSLGGTEVATSSLAKAARFDAAGGAGDLAIPVAFSPKKLGLAALGLLTGKGAGYELKGTMDLGTPYGPMSLPVEKMGRTVFGK